MSCASRTSTVPSTSSDLDLSIEYDPVANRMMLRSNNASATVISDPGATRALMVCQLLAQPKDDIREWADDIKAALTDLVVCACYGGGTLRDKHLSRGQEAYRFFFRAICTRCRSESV